MKFNSKYILWVVVVLGAALMACQEPYHQKEEQYYFIASNINIPYWQEAQNAFLDQFGPSAWGALVVQLIDVVDAAKAVATPRDADP